VGIDRIIAEAEVAKMTLYTHFPSKDDSILAVLQSLFSASIYRPVCILFCWSSPASLAGPPDTGHFALEEDGDQIADLMRQFLRKHVARK
jgi:AcrR family transcriptional regulator